jgi:hypothetical protein
MIANLKHAAHTGKTVSIGGGDFTPAECLAAANMLECFATGMHEALYRGPFKAITTKYNGNGVYSANDGDGNRCRHTPDDAQGIEERHFGAAAALCKKMGWTGSLVSGQQKNGTQVHVFVGPESIRAVGGV